MFALWLGFILAIKTMPAVVTADDASMRRATALNAARQEASSVAAYVYTGAENILSPWELTESIQEEMKQIQIQLDTPLDQQQQVYGSIQGPEQTVLAGWNLWLYSVNSGFVLEELDGIDRSGSVSSEVYYNKVPDSAVALWIIPVWKEEEPPTEESPSESESESSSEDPSESESESSSENPSESESESSSENPSESESESSSESPSQSESESSSESPSESESESSSERPSESESESSSERPSQSEPESSSERPSQSEPESSSGRPSEPSESTTETGEPTKPTSPQGSIDSSEAPTSGEPEAPSEILITGSGTFTLKKGDMCRLGDGLWTIEGDSTLYRGGRRVYAAEDGTYTFHRK